MQAGFRYRTDIATSHASLSATKGSITPTKTNTIWPCVAVAQKAEEYFVNGSAPLARSTALLPCTWLLLLRTFARSQSQLLPAPLVRYIQAYLEPAMPHAALACPPSDVDPPTMPLAQTPYEPSTAAEATGTSGEAQSDLVVDAGRLISCFEAGATAATAGSDLASSCADLCSLLLFVPPGIISSGESTQLSQATLSDDTAFFLLGSAFRLKQWANVEELIPALFHGLTEHQSTAWNLVLAKAKPQHKRKVVERLQGKMVLHLAQSMSGGAPQAEQDQSDAAAGKYATLASAGIASVTVPRAAAAAAAAAADPALGRAGNKAVQRSLAPRASIHLNTGAMKPWAKPPAGTGLMHGGRQQLLDAAVAPPSDESRGGGAASGEDATDVPRQGVYRGGAVSAAQAIRSAMPSQWTRKGKEMQRTLKGGEGVQGGATTRQPYGSAVSTIKAKMGARAVADGPAGHKAGEGGVLSSDIASADRVAETLLDVIHSGEPTLRKVPMSQRRTLLSFLLEGIREAPVNWNGNGCSWNTRIEVPWPGGASFTAAVSFAGGDLALQQCTVDTLLQSQQLPLASRLSKAWRLPERLCSALGADAAAEGGGSAGLVPYTSAWLAARSAALKGSVEAKTAIAAGTAATPPGGSVCAGMHPTAAARMLYPLETRDGTLHAPFVVFHSAASFLGAAVPLRLGQKLRFAAAETSAPILPEHSLPVLHVASSGDLEAFGDFMHTAGTAALANGSLFPVGVDVEWRPTKLFDDSMPPFTPPPGMHHETAAAVQRTYQALVQTSSLRFPAALLQVATPQAVFVIDMLAVAQLVGEEARHALGDSFLAHQGVLKLGFGLQGDLAKIAGSHSDLQGVFSAAVACVDLPSVFQRHAALRSSGGVDEAGSPPMLPPSAVASDLRSLTVACRDILGAPLAKEMQTSDWQQRPLSIEQVRYGSMDALSLLSLFAATTSATSPGTSGCPLAAGVVSEGTWWQPCVQSMTVTEAELTKQAVVACDLLPTLEVVAPAEMVHCPAVLAAITNICRTPCSAEVEPTPTSGSDAPQRSPQWLQEYLVAAGCSPCRVCQVGDAATADEAAAALGVSTARITKSLAYVVNGEAPVLVIMPGPGKVDTGKLAAAIGGGIGKRKVKLATPLQCAEIWRYTPGTFPPFGHSESVQIFIDESVPRSGLLFGGGGSLSHCVAFRPSELETLAPGSQVVDVRKIEKGADSAALLPALSGAAAGLVEEAALPTLPALAAAGSEQLPALPAQDVDVACACDAPLRVLFKPPRFAVDSMMGRLVRWLRVVGVDALKVPQTESREVTALKALQEGRIILTRDRKLLDGPTVMPCLHLSIDGTHAQFQDVAERFHITVAAEDLMSRCSKCNNKGFRQLSAADITAQGLDVPAKVVEIVDEFWQCTRQQCSKVYWEGPKFQQSRERWGNVIEEAGMAASPADS